MVAWRHDPDDGRGAQARTRRAPHSHAAGEAETLREARTLEREARMQEWEDERLRDWADAPAGIYDDSTGREW